MSFMERVLKRNIPIWDACADTPFVRELQKGTLPLERFREYMIQDSIYLKNYARVYGSAIYHATCLKDIRIYHSILNFVTVEESAVRLSWLERFSLTDEDIETMEALPPNKRYTDFLFQVAKQGKTPEMLMAVLPCMLSYSYVFRKIATLPEKNGDRYADFILDYAEDGYYERCREWCSFAEEKCGGLKEKRKRQLCHIFQKASLLELDFWRMAYGACDRSVRGQSEILLNGRKNV